MYTVTLYSSALPLPISFARHYWFLISKGAETHRYEVWAPWDSRHEDIIVVDFFLPIIGVRSTIFDSLTNPKFPWPAREEFTRIGDTGSQAERLFTIINNSKLSYPFADVYRFWPGPNSNTYIAWVLAQCPDIDYALPWNAIGKNFPLPKKHATIEQ